MRNGWTGGQYSLFRAGFGLYILINAMRRLPFSAQAPPEALFLFSSVILAALLFIVGYRDKFAAIWIGIALLWQPGAHSLWPAQALMTGLLLIHIVLPPDPYGAWGARNRLDPGSDWEFPEKLYLLAWLFMAGFYLAGSVSTLTGQLISVVGGAESNGTDIHALPLIELLLLGMFPGRRTRPFAWIVLTLLQIARPALYGAEMAGGAVLALHALTFNPRWIPARPKVDAAALLFYDGACGLCHRAVRFLLAEDRNQAFRFAPLQSALFSQTLSEKQRKDLPDSLVMRTHDGEVLTMSVAAIYALERLGGIWRITGILLRIVPPVLRDNLYAAIAAVRHRLFATPTDACPLAPAHLRARFLSSETPPPLERFE